MTTSAIIVIAGSACVISIVGYIMIAAAIYHLGEPQ